MNTKTRKVFEELLDFYTSLNDTYRVRAYRNALEDPSVMGKSLKEKASEIEKTGSLAELDLVRQYKRLVSIHGIGPKFVKKLMEMKIPQEILSDPTKLLTFPGITLTSAQKVALIYHKELSKRIKRTTITKYAGQLPLTDFEIVGSYRRGLSSSSDIDILVVAGNPVKESTFPGYLATLSKGKSKVSFLAKFEKSVFQVDILMAPEDEYWTSLLYFTGSKDFNVNMRAHAKRQGFLLNEHGLFRVLSGKKVAVTSERDIFDKIKYEWSDPVDRI